MPRRQAYAPDSDADLADPAAAYGFGLVKSHPFLDGNTRIGFTAMNMFLILNGWEIDAPQPEVVKMMLAVVAGEIDEPTLAGWVRSVKVGIGQN